MVDRIKAMVDARTDSDFFVMARTDAYAIEGLNAAIDRAAAYVEAGADGIFAEAMAEITQYQAYQDRIQAPLLANMTEFGLSPLFDANDLSDHGVNMVLYPLTAARAMHKAAEQVYQTLLSDGHQRGLVDQMQTRMELYDYLNYHEYEQRLDQLFSKRQGEE